MLTYTKTTNRELIEYLEQRDADGKLIREFDSSMGTEGLLLFAQEEDNRILGTFRVHGRLYILFRRVQDLEIEKELNHHNIVSSLRYYSLKGKGFCGVADDKGKIIIPTQYASIEPFMNDILLFSVFRNNDFFYGLMRLSGEIIIEPLYQCINPYKEALFSAIKEKKLGFLNFKGEVEIPFEYDAIDEPCYFANGLACVCKIDINGHPKYGYINHNNEIVLPFIFRNKIDFDNGPTVENEEREVCQVVGYSPGYIDRTFLISIDGTMVMTDYDDSHELDMNEWELKNWNPSPENDDNNPLDAYEGDESNRWNTD